MPHKVISGHHTTLSVGGTDIAGRVTLSGPNIEVGTQETTNLDTNNYKTYRPTIADGGDCSGEIQFDPDDTSHLVLLGLLGAPEEKTCVLTFQTETPATATFQGILTGFEVSGMGVEDNLTASFTIKVTGPVVFSTSPVEEEEG